MDEENIWDIKYVHNVPWTSYSDSRFSKLSSQLCLLSSSPDKITSSCKPLL